MPWGLDQRDLQEDGFVEGRQKWLKAPAAVEPRFERAQKVGKLSAFETTLVAALKTDAHRDRVSCAARALFVQIQAQGYRGGNSAVTDSIRAWRLDSDKDTMKAFVSLSFELGESLTRWHAGTVLHTFLRQGEARLICGC